VLVLQRLLRTSPYLLLAIPLILLPAFYDVSSAGERSTDLGLHDTLADVEDGDASDFPDGPFLSTYHLAFATTCAPTKVVRFMFLDEETFPTQYLTLVAFTVRPPPIL
jgi:hypothetical protein